MAKYLEQYRSLWRNLEGKDQAASTAVGGDFEVVGQLEFNLLRMIGLRAEHSLIDVGCGSGRLASKLSGWLQGAYLGTDILPGLLQHARDISRQPTWSFAETNGQEIPAPDESADFVCFFSVMTHITHEESWHYILESKRVLKPGGKLVCSFLEFRIRSHWFIFENTVADKSPEKVLNQFMSRDTLEAFAFNAGLEIESFIDGDQRVIPIESEMVWENGLRVSNAANLGQSVCVMRKPRIPVQTPV